MIPVLLLAGLFIGVGVALATFWKDIISWLKSAINKVREIVKGVVLGFTVFLKKMNGYIKEISKHYSKNEQERWEETIVTREVSESEIPPEILAKLGNLTKEVDISSEMQLQLSH
jgi:cell shape-determining protein MreC